MPFHQSLERLIPRRTRERGNTYYAENRVLSASEEQGVWSLAVRGTALYRVALQLEGSRLDLSCTCTYFWERFEPCKHIWAALRYASAKEIFGSRKVSYFSMRALDDVEEHDVLPFVPRVVEKVPPWKRSLSAIVRKHRGPSSVIPSRLPDEIAYVITPAAAHGLTFGIQGRSKRKKGGWSQPRGLKIRPAQVEDLPQPDQEILLILNSTGYEYFGSEFDSDYSLRKSAASYVISRAARTGRLYAELRAPGLLAGPLTWDDGDPWRFVAEVQMCAEGTGYQMTGSFRREDQSIPLSRNAREMSGLLVTDTFVAGFKPNEDSPDEELEWMDLLSIGPIEIPESDRESFRSELLAKPLPEIELPPDLRWEVAPVTPVPVLSLKRAGQELSGRLRFRYGDRELEMDSEVEHWVEGTAVAGRDRGAERAFEKRLFGFPFGRDYYGELRIAELLFAPVVPLLVDEGWKIEIDRTGIRSATSFNARIESGIDWFDLKGGASFGEAFVTIPELLEAVRKQKSWIELEGGDLGMIPSEWLESFAPIAGVGDEVGEGIRFQSNQALLIDAMLGTRQDVRIDLRHEELRDRLSRSGEVVPQNEAGSFSGELRPYQREGLGWLMFLRQTGLGGCLADDMGLGKTVQLLALLDQIQSEKKGPSLVVAPRSLLFNWKSEAARFAPQLRVLEHHGSGRDRGTEHFENYDLVLTTYGTMRRDIEHLAETDFEYVVLDEAQAIKNAGSLAAKASRLLRGRHRLALSGTPIENHLGELWSLMEFLNPGVLGSMREFQRTFASKQVAPERRALLGKAIRPFILRRTKEQVAPELPARMEQTLFCDLEGEQRKQYDELREFYRKSLLGTIQEKGLARSKMHILEALLRLRQAALHPRLVDENAEGESAKLEMLLPELSEVIESGHKALVFSQFTSFLAIIRKALDEKGIQYCYLDGATRDREEVVARFQGEGGPPLFLISLKAGGLGLNLTQADYVFLLDPWWNPAVEAQAIDRAHRIGQERSVFAYRIIARDTVEEKILQLQAQKKDLAESIINEDNSVLRKLDLEDLELLLS